MIVIKDIRAEHKKILSFLDELSLISYTSSASSRKEFVSLLKQIYNFWNIHEEKEEKLLKTISNDFPVKKMKIEHNQLKGHWKVLNLSLKSKDPVKLEMALNIDGAMFINKLKKHIAIEEKLFDKLIFA